MAASPATRSSLVGLGAQRRTRFGALSGGQRQRGLLARALAGQPRLLLLDEPFNGLDQASRDALLAVIERLKADGVALIITTHDLELARAACERTLLVNGEQVAFDETGCVLTLEQVERTFAAHAIEIDGHTLTTAEHHAAEHAERHGTPGSGAGRAARPAHEGGAAADAASR
ncbi:ATP-binding cassette domain-containing protein [Agrococcus sp. SL85]|uniref:ATP-binding cassette domain-containing protein n=1 Tax=Agrococcus sp. SL85 TaxID=2995141 RepID=UPI002D1E4774|nr:ATP-binding cassette domain-containing protein [Agrococcus sp. SL85]